MIGWDHRFKGRELSKLRKIVKDREAWSAAVHGFTKSQTWLSDWKTSTPRFGKKSYGLFILSWPKGSFRLFCKILRKTWKKFLASLITLWYHGNDGQYFSGEGSLFLPHHPHMSRILVAVISVKQIALMARTRQQTKQSKNPHRNNSADSVSPNACYNTPGSQDL